MQLFRKALLDMSFQEIHSPKLIGGASEGGSAVFTLQYFGQPACLAQSPQFYKQMAIAGDMQRVFEIGPVFRSACSRAAAAAVRCRVQLPLRSKPDSLTLDWTMDVTGLGPWPQVPSCGLLAHPHASAAITRVVLRTMSHTPQAWRVGSPGLVAKRQVGSCDVEQGRDQLDAPPHVRIHGPGL